MTRRPGMSLTEVLVALFILTIGVIGILTMFPLSAAQMARAVRDDRSALAASQADGFMRWYWATYVANPMTAGSTEPNFATPDLFLTTGSPYCLFDNPSFQATGVPGISQPSGQVSSPVIVDPMGYFPRSFNFGDSPGFSAIPRYGLNSSVTTATTPPNTVSSPFNGQAFKFFYRNCSVLDSLGYNDNGTPTPDREMRYNFMWVLQRPQMIVEPTTSSGNTQPVGVTNGFRQNNGFNQVPFNLNNGMSSPMVTNMTVVVFDRRAPQYPPPSFQGFEVVMNATFTSGLTSVVISTANADQALDLKPGSWVMDGTINNGASPYPIRQANFYRVVSVVQAGAVVSVELQSPIAPPPGYPPLGYAYQGTLVALSGVAGVFVRAPLVPYPQ